jgi:hypothetical protein
MKDDDCLFLKRDGRLEETYFSWSIIPLVGEDGSGPYALGKYYLLLLSERLMIKGCGSEHFLSFRVTSGILLILKSCWNLQSCIR